MPTRWMMAALSGMLAWRDALWNVKPDTLIGWHRKGFRLFWRWRSRPTGRPRLPTDLRQLIREMAAGNATWGEERITNELKLKLGIRVSPRTAGKYLHAGGPVRPSDPRQRWLTFVRNHAQVIAACDFFVVVTATFRTLYVFVVMDLGTRRILHHNVTAHPTAEWTAQQFREALPGGQPYRFLIHDRTEFSRRNWTSRSRTWACESCERPSERQRQIPSAKDSAGRCAGNAWTSSFPSTSAISDWS